LYYLIREKIVFTNFCNPEIPRLRRWKRPRSRDSVSRDCNP